MLQPRIPRTLITSTRLLDNLTTALTTLTLCPLHRTFTSTSRRTFTTTPTTHASHAQQGRANGPKAGAGKRLGSKKGASEYVIPGNIIFKQRGTKWFPGENCGMGRDHTIYAEEYGYVQYYRNPGLHPKRRYIGVALEKEGRGSLLPTPMNAVRRRRLGMVAAPMRVESTKQEGEGFLESHRVQVAKGSVEGDGVVVLPMLARKGRHWESSRVSNWEIAREADESKVQVRPFDKDDRFYAWRQRTKKIKMKKALRAKGMGGKRKGKGKKR